MKNAQGAGDERSPHSRSSRPGTARACRKLASVFAVCAMLATSGCAHTYDTTDRKDGDDVVKDVGRDYTMTAILLPMLIGGLLAAAASR